MFVYSTPARNQHDKLTCRTPWWLLGVDIVAASGNLTGNQYAGGGGAEGYRAPLRESHPA